MRNLLWLAVLPLLLSFGCSREETRLFGEWAAVDEAGVETERYTLGTDHAYAHVHRANDAHMWEAGEFFADPHRLFLQGHDARTGAAVLTQLDYLLDGDRLILDRTAPSTSGRATEAAPANSVTVLLRSPSRGPR